MINFAISLVILALTAGADQPAKPADAKATADAAKCPMHAKAEAGMKEKACCAKHSADAKGEKGECKKAEGMKDGKGCCAKHGEKAATPAAAAGMACNHDAKAAKAEATPAAKPATDAKTAAFVCPMHPDVTSDKAGDCSKCGMKLEKKS